LSYHLGGRNAGAQALPTIEAVDSDGTLTLFAVVNGSWLQFDVETGTPDITHPLPVSAPVIGTGNHIVVYQNGDVYRHEGSPGAWVLRGNLALGSTPAMRESFGSLKSRYRGAREGAKPAQDR
jgi:hypothetical protein